MTVFIAADHRGFALKTQLLEYLQEKNIRVEDLGNYEYVKEDDAADFAHKVAQAILQDPQKFLGIVICGSGAAVDIAANRTKGVRSGLGFDVKQVEHMKAWDNINVLALPADFVDQEKAQQLVDTFLNTPYNPEERMERRNKKLDEL